MGARRDFPIDADYAGGRLETFLRRKLGLPRTLALKALRKGWVRLGGKRARADARLESGVVVTVTNPALDLPGLEGGSRPPPPRVPPALVARARASVVFRDLDLAVSRKPWGEVVHAGTGHQAGWVDALRAALSGEGPAPEECVAIGRLDRDTSGLLVVGLRRAAVRELFETLKAGRLARTYQALVAGRMQGERGTINLPLEKLPRGEIEQVCPSEDGKPALTRWSVRRRLGAATLLDLTIETGRTHQIRAHLEAVGHPILGDPRHGGTLGAAGVLTRRAELDRLFLHAGVLDLEHPAGAKRRFEDPLPLALARAVERLR